MPKKAVQQAQRDEVLRTQLLEHLSDVLQGLLRPVGDTSKLYVRPQPQQNPDLTRIPQKVFGNSDLTNTLCSSLEAVLVHGIKDSYSSRVSSFFAADHNRMPVPNFWPVVMSVCHKDDIKEVCSLAFITSDVGRGRAWLRLKINEGQIASYLDALTRETGVVKDYYRASALLRHPESCYQLLGTLQPLSSLHFQLATNAAILNTWTQTPLVLAGLWHPPQGHVVHGWSHPVKEGIDIASTVPDEDSSPGEAGARERPSMFADDDTTVNDHLLYAILAATPSTNFIDGGGEEAAAGPDSIAVTPTPRNKPIVVRTLHPKPEPHGRGDHTSEQERQHLQEDNDEGEDLEDERDVDSSLSQQQQQLKDGNDSLVGSYIMDRSMSDDGSIITSASSLDYNTLISRRLDSVDYRYVNSDGPFGAGGVGVLTEDKEDAANTPSPVGSEERSSASNDFVVVTPSSQALQVTRASALVSRLCSQYGLDEQNYQCYQCRAFIGLFYGEFRVCAMDGRSYCSGCHSGDLAVVPGRVLHNWDLRAHPVSDATRAWLQDNMDTPMMDVRATNPRLYQHVDELAQLRSLRTQLLYLRAYLFTCTSPGVADKLRSMLWPREHLYEHVHLYSLADLVLISHGGLVVDVQQAVCFARVHVRDCERCTARGFLCEICGKHDVIFPFLLDVAQTCPLCCGVYHRSCSRTVTECPRCVRWAARRLQQQQEQRRRGERSTEEEQGARGDKSEERPTVRGGGAPPPRTTTAEDIEALPDVGDTLAAVSAGARAPPSDVSAPAAVATSAADHNASAAVATSAADHNAPAAVATSAADHNAPAAVATSAADDDNAPAAVDSAPAIAGVDNSLIIDGPPR